LGILIKLFTAKKRKKIKKKEKKIAEKSNYSSYLETTIHRLGGMSGNQSEAATMAAVT